MRAAASDPAKMAALREKYGTAMAGPTLGVKLGLKP
jgi:hypothetical protein